MSFVVTLILAAIGVVIVTSSKSPPTSLIEYSVNEEQPVGTIVGNVSQHHGAISNETANLRFFFHPNSYRYLIIDPTTGIVRTAMVIDRESLCEFDEYCDLEPVNVIGLFYC
jgi:hypothetical protein